MNPQARSGWSQHAYAAGGDPSPPSPSASYQRAPGRRTQAPGASARIAVYGATGTTGALVVKEVLRRGLSCRALGRDARALAALRDVETAACAVTALAPALTGVGLVINCAGPFCDTRRAVEDAALQAGIHVVHICGELAELTELFARDAELRAANVTVVGAAGFSSAVAELVCWLAIKGLTPPLALEVVHGAAASVPSAGSLLSYLKGAGAELGGDDDVKVVELPPPVGARAVRSAPLAEGVTLPRSLGVDDVTCFLAVGPPRAAVLKPAVFTRDPAALQRMLAWRAERGTRGPGDDERAAMAFALKATARTRSHGARTVDMVGADPYGLTALLAVQIAIDVLRSPRAGARAPLEVLDPQPALAALAHAGVRWSTRSFSTDSSRPS
jgi:short subunit dehydrogenase-like uncharacterized protein